MSYNILCSQNEVFKSMQAIPTWMKHPLVKSKLDEYVTKEKVNWICQAHEGQRDKARWNSKSVSYY